MANDIIASIHVTFDDVLEALMKQDGCGLRLPINKDRYVVRFEDETEQSVVLVIERKET